MKILTWLSKKIFEPSQKAVKASKEESEKIKKLMAMYEKEAKKPAGTYKKQ